jgi:2-oxoglutarate dehydrogenase E1 component
MADSQPFSPDSLSFAEGLYEDFVREPASVPEDWRRWFASQGAANLVRGRVGPSFAPPSLFDPARGRNGVHAASAPAVGSRQTALEARTLDLQDRADQLMRSFRVRGHLAARLDPLDRPSGSHPELEPGFYGITESDLDRRISAQTFHGATQTTLREALERMRSTYCRSIGVQFMHIDDLAIKRWLQERMESTQNRLALSHAEQVRILTKLTDAVMFEEFVQKKFLGAKSFSLEGSESLIPLLDLAIQRGGELGVREVVIAMAHRGRLNVLANIMGKSPAQIFREFEDTDPELYLGRGDVKYHKGHSSTCRTECGREVHLSLCFNPSHLEFVNPVALGRMRAKQERFGDARGDQGLVVLVHGDAAFAGQGVVQETLNLSELEPYSVGGAIHIVVNNQIGFTTPPSQARSSTYCTDVAKMLQIPIFHVNGEDPEAVALVIQLALDFRRNFRRDVVVDMYGYRRRGHNEGDEPAFTDPLLYQAIASRKGVREGYLDHLLGVSSVTREEADQIAARRRAHLEAELDRARSAGFVTHHDPLPGAWNGFAGGSEERVPRVDTGVERSVLERLLTATCRVPEGFLVHPKLERWLELRREMARGARPLDWAAAESLAFATLAESGHPVRLTGQDSERGTFSHRHAVLHDVRTGARLCPLEHVAPEQAPVVIRNSPLSEVAVLGFEYGFSLDYPEALVAWEAQFGDFANVAQVVIDQFLVSAEEKWSRLSGLVLLLPHGFEGQGPEHSSARIDRFLALAADDNIQVVVPTTPAQIFHVLRRQVVRKWRKPLVVMTPKSLLRHPRATSALGELASGRFQRVLSDGGADPARVKKIALCSGKIYFDLAEERERRRAADVAILRLEQLYPLQDSDLEQAFSPYADTTPVVWVQEEPENMGAWRFFRARFGERIAGQHPFTGVARRASPSPATGSLASHQIEQRSLLDRVFEP